MPRQEAPTRLVVVLGIVVVQSLMDTALAVRQNILWIPQFLGNPFEGQFTGIATADLNGDGRPDLLISAGKHWIDQSYALINLGPNYRAYGVLVSLPLALGPPSGHYAVQAGKFASFQDNEWGVLLAGADCSTPKENALGTCTPGRASAAVLLRVKVQGCIGTTTTSSMMDKNAADADCTLDWTVAWQDAKPMGDRNAALAYDLGNTNSNGNPAIILVGNGGAAIYEAPYNQDDGEPTFRIVPPQKLPWLQDAIVRGTGLAVGPIGTQYTGFFVGTRSMHAAPPAPVVGVWKTGPSDYAWYSLGDANNRYVGDDGLAVQATGLVLADLNGDGIQDLIEANHLDGPQRVAGFPIQQDYYLLDEEGFGEPASFAWEMGGGRTVAAGKLFADSDLPDVVLGTADGYIVWFANLGLDAQGNFMGLQERHRRMTVANCEVRSLQIVPDLVRPCAPSVVAVVYCNEDTQRGGVFAFHDATTTCPSSSSAEEDVVSPDAPAATPVGQPPLWNDHGQPQDQDLQGEQKDGEQEEEGYVTPVNVNGVVADTVPLASASRALYKVHPGVYAVSSLMAAGLCLWLF